MASQDSDDPLSTTAEIVPTAVPPGQARDQARLLVIAGPRPGHQCVVGSAVVIGRSPECDLTLDDSEVSRRHCRIALSDTGEHLLTDLGSRNGTLVDGTRVHRHVLRFGQRIQLGRRVLLLFTHHDPLREALLQRQKMEALGRLGAGVAHDLNNLLSVMTASLRHLEHLGGNHGLDDDPVRECLEDIAAAVEASSDLTRRLVHVARPADPERMDTVDVSALLLELTRLVARVLPSSIDLDAAIAPGLVVRGDAEALKQVLMNLAVNARDAMPEGGTLSIRADPIASSDLSELAVPVPTAFVAITVADTGVGMDEATRTRIFEPFFSTKGPASGTGLGLSSAYEIVAGHGGHIEVQSEPGRGSRFRVLLPAGRVDRAAGPRTPRQAVSSGEIPGARTARILVVDDQRLVRRSTARLLRGLGHEIEEADSGERALEIIASGLRPELVLLDLDMPGMGGEECFRRLRREAPGLRVVFLSGVSDEARLHGLQGEGAAACLQKPVPPERLQKTIQQVLAQR